MGSFDHGAPKPSILFQEGDCVALSHREQFSLVEYPLDAGVVLSLQILVVDGLLGGGLLICMEK